MIELRDITGLLVQNGCKRADVERVVSCLGLQDFEGHVTLEYPAGILIGMMLDKPDDLLESAAEEVYNLTVSDANWYERDTGNTGPLDGYLGNKFGESLAIMAGSIAQTENPHVEVRSFEVNQWPEPTASLILQFGRRYVFYLNFGASEQIREHILSPLRRSSSFDGRILDSLGRLYREALNIQPIEVLSEPILLTGDQAPFAKETAGHA